MAEHLDQLRQASQQVERYQQMLNRAMRTLALIAEGQASDPLYLAADALADIERIRRGEAGRGGWSASISRAS